MYSENEDNVDGDSQVEAIEEAEEDNTQNEDDGQDENNKENESKKVIKPKRTIRNPRVTLKPETLKGPRGLEAIPELFSKQKFKGKGHEEADLHTLLRAYQYWAHRMAPKFPFEEAVDKIEKLGTKRPVITLIKKIRMGLMEPEKATVNAENNSSGDDEEEEGADEKIPRINMDAQFNALREVEEPVQLTEEQKERIRINRENAIKRRQERLKEIQQKAESKLVSSATFSQLTENSQQSQDLFPEETENDSHNDKINEDLASLDEHVLVNSQNGKDLQSQEDNSTENIIDNAEEKDLLMETESLQNNEGDTGNLVAQEAEIAQNNLKAAFDNEDFDSLDKSDFNNRNNKNLENQGGNGMENVQEKNLSVETESLQNNDEDLEKMVAQEEVSQNVSNEASTDADDRIKENTSRIDKEGDSMEYD